jgi:hypothetical protein
LVELQGVGGGVAFEDDDAAECAELIPADAAALLIGLGECLAQLVTDLEAVGAVFDQADPGVPLSAPVEVVAGCAVDDVEMVEMPKVVSQGWPIAGR